jgi:hypothetical protein
MFDWLRPRSVFREIAERRRPHLDTDLIAHSGLGAKAIACGERGLPLSLRFLKGRLASNKWLVGDDFPAGWIGVLFR